MDANRMKTPVRWVSRVLAVISLVAGAVSVYALTYYESLGPEILLRHRPEFIRSVTDPAMLALVLALAAAVSYVCLSRPRSALVLCAAGCFAFLNFYYLWTSRAVLELLTPVMSDTYLYPLQSYGFGFGSTGNLPVDLISVGFLVTFCACVFLLYRRDGPVKGFLRTLQLGSLALVPLCLDIPLFDPSEFDVHVTSLQEHYNVLPWFSNADMLATILAVFLATTFMLAVLGRHRRERKSPVTVLEADKAWSESTGYTARLTHERCPKLMSAVRLYEMWFRWELHGLGFP
jgi:hypothetical protein